MTDANKGECCKCPSPALPGKSRCRKCLDYSRVKQDEYKARQAAKGLCSGCPNVPMTGKTRCETCLARSVASVMRRAKRLRALGVCAIHMIPLVPGRKRCVKCQEYLRTVRASAKMNGLCGIHNTPFTIGSSCSMCAVTSLHKKLRKHGMTLDRYEKMLLSQNSACAICNRPETLVLKGGMKSRLAIDHDHKTGAVRGLLCSRCNTTIGRAEDDVLLLQSMIDYLKKHTVEVRSVHDNSSISSDTSSASISQTT